MASFYQTVTEAVNDFAAKGYDSMTRLEYWSERIREAALREMRSEDELADALRRALQGHYGRLVDRGAILKNHKAAERFTLAKVAPSLRAELDRRILASADLIKLNREQSVEKTLQRFKGWATSIPPGGSRVVDKLDTKETIGKALKQLPFEERRVIIDQGHKFTSELNNILAVDGGALAAIWHSNWRQPGYDFRDRHKHVDEELFVIRGNWAMAAGLMKLDGHRYTDDIERTGELPFCRCFYEYLYSLSDLPDSMLTVRGRAELERIRGIING